MIMHCKIYHPELNCIQCGVMKCGKACLSISSSDGARRGRDEGEEAVAHHSTESPDISEYADLIQQRLPSCKYVVVAINSRVGPWRKG